MKHIALTATVDFTHITVYKSFPLMKSCASVALPKRRRKKISEETKMKRKEGSESGKYLDFNVLNEEISRDNVLAMSECIVFAQVRYLISYVGTRMQKMFEEFYGDIKHKDEVNHVISDGYDLVQECALYLCEHYGGYLSDVIGYNN